MWSTVRSCQWAHLRYLTAIPNIHILEFNDICSDFSSYNFDFLFYLISIVLGLFGVNMGFLHDSSPLSIGISVFIVIIASLNLVLDFDFIENGAEIGAPKYMEWYAAFGLMVTLIWLYIELLHLLVKLQSRD